MFGADLVGPGGGGFNAQLPPDLRSLLGPELRGPGAGGFGPDFFVVQSGSRVETFTPLEVPAALTPGLLWPFSKRQGLTPVLSFGGGFPMADDMVAALGQGIPTSTAPALPWDELDPAEVGAGTGWQDAVPQEHAASMPWGLLQPAEHGMATPWGDTAPAEHTTALWWRSPPIMDVINSVPWGRMAVLDEAHAMPWPVPDMVHPEYRIPWGMGRQPPTLVPHPDIDEPVPDQPVPDPPIYTPPPGDQVALDFRCSLEDWQGDQVPLPFRRLDCLRRVIVVDNDIICRRPDTGEEFACLELGVQGDIESFTDGFTAVLPHTASAMLTGPLEIELIINGITHLMVMESWTEDSQFNADGRRDTFRIRGRSISAELDAPYSPPRSRFETENRTALQLMTQELPVDGSWSLVADPGWNDYTVPGGTFSYTDLTPLRAISRIAAATGAVVQQVPGERTLKIMPRYTVDPWKQAGTVADTEVDFGMVRARSGEFRPVALANGIYVAGESAGGVLVEATRTGTSGAPWLDTVTDALITDPQAGLARARAELGATGKRTLYQLELPLATGVDEPGLLTPGQLVHVVEDVSTSWHAQAIGWSLAGRWSEANGLEIWQSATVERYRDA